MAEHLLTRQLREGLVQLLQSNRGNQVSRETIDAAVASVYSKLGNHSKDALKWKSVGPHLMAVATNMGVAIKYVGKSSDPTGIVIEMRRSKYEERKTRAWPAKQKIGRAVWRLLLQGDHLQHDSAYVSVKQLKHTGVRDKIRALGMKSGFSTMIDSGSTTLAVMDQLLASPCIPVPIYSKGKFEHMVRPDIVTNSPEILNLLLKHPVADDKLSVTVIGGEYDWDLRELSGPSAESFLRSERVHVDVAIVGVTGTKEGEWGLGFGCDTLSTARMKSACLERAWLRILVFESAKLRLDADVRYVFTSLSEHHIDVIVTDDDPAFVSHRRDLLKRATDARVEVVIASD
ncbi:MAG: hypothetical protein U1F71_18410 [Verrucomicrobiaceae bacterium]